MPDLNWTQLKFLLNKHGWKQIRQEGSHSIWEKGNRHERIAVGHGHSMGGGGLKEVLERFGIEMTDVTEPAKIKRRGGKKTPEVPAEGTFGRRLYDSRTKLGLSQGGVAKIVGTQQAQISAWERNAVNPLAGTRGKLNPNTKKVLLLLAEKFGWNDLLVTIKSAQEQIVTKTRLQGAIPESVGVEKKRTETPSAPKPKEEPKIYVRDAIEIVKDVTQAKAEVPVKATKEEKEFATLIDADSIWIFVTEQENKIKKLESELKKAYTEDIVEMRRKAKLYDELRTKFFVIAPND